MKAIIVTDEAAGTAGMKLVERPEPQAYGTAVVATSFRRYFAVNTAAHCLGRAATVRGGVGFVGLYGASVNQ